MTQKRPGLHSEFVARETAEAMLQLVNAYGMKRGTKNSELTESYLNELRQQLTIAVMNYKTPQEMVAFMRGCSIKAVPEDDDLVKIMSGVAKKKIEVYHRLVKSWVKDSCVSTTRRVGDKVLFERDGKAENGVISQIDSETAQYVVFCEHLGHVKKGIGVTGVYVNYEDVKV